LCINVIFLLLALIKEYIIDRFIDLRGELKMADKKFAVIETGGKQYQVEVGTIIDIEKLDVETSNKVTFDKVLLMDDGKDLKIGQPYVEGAKISATVLNQHRDDKKIVFKPLHLLEKEREKVIGGGHDRHSDHCKAGGRVGD